MHAMVGRSTGAWSDLVTVELLHVYVDGNKIKDFNLIKWKKCKENKINLQLNRISKSN